MRNVLTVAGSDCSGGAGIQADLKTFSAHGVYGMSVITSVVAENTSRVISAEEISPEMIKAQLAAVFEDIEVHAVKLGMLSRAETISAVAEKLSEYRPQFLAADPVMLAKDGYPLMEPKALDAYKSRILPLVYLLTPNIPEAEVFTGTEIKTVHDMKAAAEKIRAMGAENVLIKGGHLDGEAVDVLFDGKSFFTFEAKRISGKSPHGTGCTLSSAIAANLANGLLLEKAVEKAKEYLLGAIGQVLPVGKGNPPVNHFYEWTKGI